MEKIKNWLREHKGFVFVVYVMSMLILACIFIVLLSYVLFKKECLTSYENYQPNFSFFGDCRVMIDGKLTPVDMVKILK